MGTWTSTSTVCRRLRTAHPTRCELCASPRSSKASRSRSHQWTSPSLLVSTQPKAPSAETAFLAPHGRAGNPFERTHELHALGTGCSRRAGYDLFNGWAANSIEEFGYSKPQKSPCNEDEFVADLPAGYGYYYDPLNNGKGWCRSIRPENLHGIREAYAAGRWSTKKSRYRTYLPKQRNGEQSCVVHSRPSLRHRPFAREPEPARSGRSRCRGMDGGPLPDVGIVRAHRAHHARVGLSDTAWDAPPVWRRDSLHQDGHR